MLRPSSTSRRYSSIDNSTCAGFPRSVMNTGPVRAAFFARRQASACSCDSPTPSARTQATATRPSTSARARRWRSAS
jgi:hypothetical protein